VQVALGTHDTVAHVLREQVRQALRVADTVAHCLWVTEPCALPGYFEIVAAAIQAIVSVIAEFCSVAQLVTYTIAHKRELTEGLAAIRCRFSPFRANNAISSIIIVRFYITLRVTGSISNV
jgi:hypothetical protein